MQCPFCKEEIIDGAIKCKHCGTMLDNNRTSGGMEGWQAIILAIVLFILIIISASISPVLPLVIVVASSFWASFDAVKLGTKNYSSKFMTASPAVVFLGGLLLWAVVFPWYLYFRSNVKAGKVAKKIDSVVMNNDIPDIVDREL